LSTPHAQDDYKSDNANLGNAGFPAAGEKALDSPN
jgi:hypothetical protein